MHFSIVIVSYNTCDFLRICLQSYLSQIQKGVDEIIVVDNNSPDNSVEMVRSDFPQVRLIANEVNLGFAKACNLGWRQAKHDVIIFSNGDIKIADHFIATARQEVTRLSGWGLMGPELRSPDDDIIQASWSRDLSFVGEFLAMFFSPVRVARHPFIKRLTIRRQRCLRPAAIVAGACLLAKRTMLQAIGGFDEKFVLYFEDADLCHRCRQAGWSVWFNPALRAYHGLGQSGKSMARKIQLIYRQSQIYYYRRHNTLFEFWLLKLYLTVKWVMFRGLWKDSAQRTIFFDIIKERRLITLTDEIE